MNRARELRQNQTDAERALWLRLRAARLGVKFRRQHPVAGYYADFCCIERQLIVELDGGQHLQQAAYDAKRTAVLKAEGFRVLRFWNDEVLLRLEDVLEEIIRVLGERAPPLPSPLPRLRQGRGSKLRSASSSLSSGSSIAGGEGWGKGGALHLRAHLYRHIRQFFFDRDVLEVETPILSTAGNTDPNIESFTTHFTGHVDAGQPQRWLRTSAEFPMKRLLAAGVGDCYELGRVFRNCEAGRRHNPEFTMLEWYRVGWDHRQLMDETVDLVQTALALVGRRAEVRVTSYRQLFLDVLALDPMTAPIEMLREPLARFGIGPDGLERDDWLDLLLTHLIQPDFPSDRITVIHDYPASQCALARIRAGDPPLAERFELYLGSYELANGYHELNDAAEQRARFERDNARRRQRRLAEMPIDERLLATMEALPDCAGVALGVERLLMSLLGTDAIANVLTFPFAEA